MKKLLLFIVLFAVGNVFSQKKNAALNETFGISCKCSDVVLYPYFYYKDPEDQANSHLYLRFDFHHKGKTKCKPEFTGNITIFRDATITATIPLNALTSFVNTENQRIFVITALNLPASFRPMTLGGNYKITYSLQYGTGACPATSTKIVRFAKSEPIL